MAVPDRVAQWTPIPRTRIFFQSWRGDDYDYELGTIHEHTDENGVGEWNEAPADPVECDICPPGGMTLGRQSLVAREEEHVFTPPPLLVISGRVVDAETKEPIRQFDVDDVLADQYELTVQLRGVSSERFSASGPVLASLTQTFTVPEIEGGRCDDPLDLGILTLRRIWRP